MMSKSKKIFAVIILLSYFNCVFGQKEHSVISGYITDKTGEELINALVTFIPDNDSLMQYPYVCGIDGYFQLEFPKGEYHFSLCLISDRFSRMVISQENKE